MWQLSVFILFAFASFPLYTTVTALFNTSSVSTILPSYHFSQSITSKVEQNRTNLSSTSSALNMSLRAWQCSGRTNLEMVENLKLVSEHYQIH